MTRFDLAFAYQTTTKPEPFRLEVKVAWQARATGIFGPSGSGKSTLLEVLLGLRPLTQIEGQAAIGDRTLFNTTRGAALSPSERRLGWVPQDAGLFPHLSVERNLRFAERAESKVRFEDATALLELGTLLGRRPDQLSGGERQRVALGRALIAPHDLLLLDEPLSSLDAPRRTHLLGYIQRVVRDAGVPLVYVSHDWQEIRNLCEYALLFDTGAVLAHGHPNTLNLPK